MKISYLTLLLILLNFPLSAQRIKSHLKGTVTYQNGNGIPAVEVWAEGANQVITGNFGEFTLEFSTLDPGTPVTIELKKDGLEVMNIQEKSQQTCNLNPHNKCNVVIRMTKIGEKDEKTVRIYNQLIQQLTADYEKKMNKIQSQYKESINILRDSLRILKEEKSFAELKAKDLAERIARANLNEDSDTYNQIIRYFEDGNFEAIDKILLNADFVTERRNILNQRIQEDNNYTQKLLLQVDYLISRLEFEKAQKILEDASNLEPQNLEIAQSLANLLLYRRKFALAIRTYLNTLKIIKLSSKDSAKIYTHLGIAYSRNKAFEKSFECHKKAIQIYERLIKKQPQEYTWLLATAKSNFGISYHDYGNYLNDNSYFLKSLQLQEEALAIKEKLIKEFPRKYASDFLAIKWDIMTEYHNLGVNYFKLNKYHSGCKRYDHAANILQKSYRILETIPYQGLETLKIIADFFQTLGEINYDLVRCDSKSLQNAYEFYSESLKYYQLLDSLSNGKYRYKLTDANFSMGQIYKYKRNADSTIHFMKIAIRQSEELLQEEPENLKNLINIAHGNNELGMVYRDLKNDKNTARRHFQVSIDAFSVYQKQPGEKYRGYLQDLEEVRRNLRSVE
jgi:hypothetical protein